jgi:hypothetical protein
MLLGLGHAMMIVTSLFHPCPCRQVPAVNYSPIFEYRVVTSELAAET